MRDRMSPILRLLKELYLSIFVLFFYISRWKGRMRASSAAAGVSMAELLVAFTAWSWFEVAVHHRINLNRWIVGICSFLIFAHADYVLVVGGRGETYEKQFRHFGKGKQIALTVSAIGIMLVIGITYFLSVHVYHQMFHISPPR